MKFHVLGIHAQRIFLTYLHLVFVNNLRDKELLDKLGNRLKELRMAKGLTLEQLAYASEMELSQVHRIEKSKVNPTITTLSAIAKGLDVTLSELLASL